MRLYILSSTIHLYWMAMLLCAVTISRVSGNQGDRQPGQNISCCLPKGNDCAISCRPLMSLNSYMYMCREGVQSDYTPVTQTYKQLTTTENHKLMRPSTTTDHSNLNKSIKMWSATGWRLYPDGWRPFWKTPGKPTFAKEFSQQIFLI